MRNENQTFFFLFVDFFKPLDQHGKAPQVNASLRLIENADFMRFCKHRCNLQTFHLSAGECAVHLTVQVIGRAESDGREEFTTLCFRQLFSGCQRQHFFHRHSFKTRRLLECIADAGVCAVVNIITGNIFLIQEDFSAIGVLNSCKHFGQR